MSDGARTEAETIEDSDVPVTPVDVADALRAVGVERGDLVIAHSSLSRLGWVVGGPRAIVDALVDVVGEDGTIVMPAQTGISDPATWVNPPVPERWWETIRETWPAFDPDTTPMRAMGAVVACFRGLARVVHSGHPAVGFVAWGRLADDVTAGHRLEQALDDRSPLGALYRNDAKIVLIGVGHGNNTSLHLAEHRAEYAGKRDVSMGAPLVVDGQRRWVTYRDLDRDDEDFAAIGDAYEAAGGAVATAPLGQGVVTACPMPALVDFAVDWLHANRRQTPAQP